MGTAVQEASAVTGCYDKPPAEAYMQLARLAVTLAYSVNDLRDWWADERENRSACGLSKAQIDELADLCKARVVRIRDEAPKRTQRGKPPPI